MAYKSLQHVLPVDIVNIILEYTINYDPMYHLNKIYNVAKIKHIMRCIRNMHENTYHIQLAMYHYQKFDNLRNLYLRERYKYMITDINKLNYIEIIALNCITLEDIKIILRRLNMSKTHINIIFSKACSIYKYIKKNVIYCTFCSYVHLRIYDFCDKCDFKDCNYDEMMIYSDYILNITPMLTSSA